VKTQTAIQSFLRNRQALNRKPKTIQWYKEQLARFCQAYPELPTDPEPIEEFLASIKSTPETRHAYYRTLKAFYRFLSRRQHLPNPIELIDPPSCPDKIMPTLEPREMMRILNVAETLRDKTILSLFIDSGGRTGELATLRKQNIGEDYIKVDGKRGERLIPISDETGRLLLVLSSTSSKSDFVFIGRKGTPLTRSGIYKLVHGLMIKAGIQGPKLGGHRLRHSFGKGYLVNGGDVRSLQQIMGHRNITTTQKYAALNLSDTIQKHHQFTPLRAVHAAAQESFFKESALREAEEILKVNKDDLVSVGAPQKENKADRSKAGAGEIPTKKKRSDSSPGMGKTPLLPGLS